MKKHFWKIEYSVTLLTLLCLIMLFFPLSLENYWQAGIINRWNERYNKLSYMFSVINAQRSDDILLSFAKTNDEEERGKLLYQLVKPYMRISPIIKYPKSYKPKFMNGVRVPKDSEFYFDDLYFSEKRMTIVGLKDGIYTDNKNDWFAIMVDMNGLLPPNTWGKDIFGLYVYNEGTVNPFGYDVAYDDLKKDCSKGGSGLYCSYYYLIGVEFDD